MHVLAASLGLALASLGAAAAPFPLSNGFPDLNETALAEVNQEAFGTLSNGSVPAALGNDESLNNFRLINFNEEFEVAFFSELLSNITSGVEGFTNPTNSTDEFDFVIAQLKATLAQEQLHALSAVNALKHFGADPIQPCGKYDFPVVDLDSAFTFASTFTSVVLGTLQDVIADFISNGDGAFAPLIASVIGQEGEQEGWFRTVLGKIPNELPFLTRSTRDFAFSILQTFVDPSSCPNIGDIQLTTFKPITVLDAPGANDTTVHYAVSASDVDNSTQYYVTYINQQNVPLVLPANLDSNDGTTATFSADFPYTEHLLNGLTIATITDQAGPFDDVPSASKAACFAPGIIIVN